MIHDPVFDAVCRKFKSVANLAQRRPPALTLRFSSTGCARVGFESHYRGM